MASVSSINDLGSRINKEVRFFTFSEFSDHPMDRLLPASYKRLCYRNFESGDEPPPFNLLVDPKCFIAAEFAGINQGETEFIEALHINPVFSAVAIDFIGYERKFIHDMDKLLIIIAAVTLTDPSLSRSLLPCIQQVVTAHHILLGDLEEIMRKHVPTFFKDYVLALTDARTLFEAHSHYISQFLTVENFAHNLAFSCPAEHRDRLEGDLLIHFFKLPLEWQKYAASTATDILWSFPADEDRRILGEALNDFRRQNSDLGKAIDSIPKLEQISKLFLREPFPIAVRGRRFVKQGRTLKQCRKTLSERELLLFSDMLMYVQPKGGKFMVPGVYNLAFLRVVPSVSNGHPCLEIYSPSKSFVVLFTEADDRDNWNLALQDAILNARAHRKISPYREAPLWVPDSTSNECMECKAPLGFFKRKHHCRVCGLIKCSSCLSKKFLLPLISGSPSAVCQGCYEALVREQVKPQKSLEDELARFAEVKPKTTASDSESSDE
jgi:hypothetical protein